MGKKEYLNILVKFNDFILYQEKTGDYYLDRKNGYRIYSTSKGVSCDGELLKLNEIFEGTQVNYSINKNLNGYTFLFKTIKNNEYRIDLVSDKDITDLFHIGFSLSSRNVLDYDILTEFDESKEVFSKVIYILKDADSKIGSPEYCIGATGNAKKDRIYQYMMKYIDGWEKRNTDAYNLGWGIFFNLKSSL